MMEQLACLIPTDLILFADIAKLRIEVISDEMVYLVNSEGKIFVWEKVQNIWCIIAGEDS